MVLVERNAGMEPRRVADRPTRAVSASNVSRYCDPRIGSVQEPDDIEVGRVRHHHRCNPSFGTAASCCEAAALLK